MSAEYRDNAVPTRKGEELNLENLRKCLLENIPEANGELSVSQFPGGFSNLTYLLKLSDKELVLRRPPFGAKVKSGHDMGREYKILSGLNAHYKKVPKPYYFTDDESVIGTPFYVMERVNGVILRLSMPKEHLPNAEKMKGISSSLIDTFAELHNLDYEVAGLAQLGRPEGYVQRQVEGWGKRYYAARTDDIPSIEHALKWLEGNQPTQSCSTLIHNDFKYDNLILDPDDWTNVLAVLDWEMATIGDPLLDLGTSLGYWVNANDPDMIKALGLNVSLLPGNPKREELLHLYSIKTGRSIDNPVFIYVYGLFKIAVIIQQIYLRYQKGLTKDPRFANLINGVKAIGDMAQRAIEKKKIDDLY
ncbi:MAG: phosphotransferase family protein [Cyclobacteriaceae bacterium]